MKQMLTGALLAFVCVCGCTSYYRVTDPSTDKTYYTKDVKNAGGGAVKIIDESNGNTVTLQNSEVKKIEKQEFQQGIYSR